MRPFSLLLAIFLLSAMVVIPAAAQDPVLIAVKQNAKWGYVNPAGKSVIPSKFSEAYHFYNGRAVAVENNQFGIIDAKGKWIVAPRPGLVKGEINSNRVVCADEQLKWGAIDIKGKQAVPFMYDGLSAFQQGLAITGVKSANPDLFQVSVVDTLGKSVIDFDNIYLPIASLLEGKKVREGYVSVLVDGDYEVALTPADHKLEDRQLYLALLDVKNKRLVSAKISSLWAEVREGRFNFTADGISYSWAAPLPAEPALSDAKFSILAPSIYSFSSGIAAIHKDGKWAFVDKDGSLLSETNLPVTDYTNDRPGYAGGFVIFRKKGGEGIFTDLKGVQRIPLDFEELEPFQYGAAVVKLKGKYGLIQKDGTWALKPEYDGIKL